MERVDVAIVGGGPAGAAAGRAAAAGDAETVVIERGVPRADRPGPGPDSTDAAGMLDYWVDIMGIPFEEIPEDVVLRRLDRADFYGPSERCTLRSTYMDGSFPDFGFTFHRTRMDDWLRERAEAAGATYRVGVGVRDVETELDGRVRHRLELADGSTIEAGALILADGPQRPVTMRVLDRLLPADRAASTLLGPARANHVAYQEHRRFPEEVFEPTSIQFWWGYIPGETAYPWIFPNDGTVARVGLTMPMGLSLEDVARPGAYPLCDSDDEELPAGSVFLRRLLERLYGDQYDIETDFPLVEDRGKRGGTEAYAISSTSPIDSPTAANIAVAGGAMGTTSAFHEGGYHVAVRSGSIAGELAAAGRLDAYNDAWKDAIGGEIRRNVAMASVVKNFDPDDWDRTLRNARRLLATRGDVTSLATQLRGGFGAAGLMLRYRLAKRRLGRRGYVQIAESDYSVGPG